MKDEPAFPTDAQSALRHDHFEGMTLRDYFAAKAMQAEISRQGLEGSSTEFTAVMAYEQADAMLIERNRTKE